MWASMPDCDATRRQRRYERRLVEQLLKAYGMPGHAVGKQMRVWGDDFGWGWFNQEYEGQLPVAVASRRLRRPVGPALLTGPLEETEPWEWYARARADWSGGGSAGGTALVFDCHGDGVGDQVLHDCRALLPRGGHHHVLRPGRGRGACYLQPWKSFVSRLVEGYPLLT